MFEGADTNDILGIGSIMLHLGGCSHRSTNLPMRTEVWRLFVWCQFQLHICKYDPFPPAVQTNKRLRIHHKQTLALFCGILPFAMASEMDWWAVPLVAFVAFTLYGIEGIAQTYEDPFGSHKIDINMDDIVEDARREVEVMLTAWQTQGPTDKGIFRPRVGNPSALNSPRSEIAAEYYSDHPDTNEEVTAPGSQVKFVFSDASERSSFIEDEPSGGRRMRHPSSVSPGDTTSRGE